MRLIDVDELKRQWGYGDTCDKCQRDSRKCQYEEITRMDVCSMLDDAPTVEAIPLEQICGWLAGYASPPQYALNATRVRLMPSVNDLADAWKYHFRELQKSGLLDTEAQ